MPSERSKAWMDELRERAALLPRCGEIARRTGEPCRRLPVHGGWRCSWHGGVKVGGRGQSRAVDRRIPRRIEGRAREAIKDPRILELTKEIAHYIAWYEEYKEGLAGREADYGQLRAFLDGIGALKEKAFKMKYGEKYTVTVEGMIAIAAGFADIVNRRVGVCPHCREDLVGVRGLIAADVRAIMNKGDGKGEVVEVEGVKEEAGQ